MFMGEFQHNIDSKGRLIVPAKFREALGLRFIVTRGMDGCLFGYTLSEWEKFTQKMQQLPLSKSQGRQIMRHFFSQAAECEIDKQGRINIPPSLRSFASLEKGCVIVGISDHLEIWDEEKWQEVMKNSDENFDQIAEDLDFGF